jgi:hypothetical protein
MEADKVTKTRDKALDELREMRERVEVDEWNAKKNASC